MITIVAFDRDGGLHRIAREAGIVLGEAGRPFAHGLSGTSLPDAYLRVDLESRHVTEAGEVAFADFRTARAKEPTGCVRSLCRRIVANAESRGFLPLLCFEDAFGPLLSMLDRRRLAQTEGRASEVQRMAVALAAGEDAACFLATHPERPALVGRIEGVLAAGRVPLSPFVGSGVRLRSAVLEGRVAFVADSLEPGLDLHVAGATLLAAVLFGLDAPALDPGPRGLPAEPTFDLARNLLSAPFVEYYAARVEGRTGSPRVPFPG